MKKALMIAVYCFSVSLYAAERETSVHCLINGTLFSIIKGCISAYGNHVDLMVLGWNQQRKLQEPDFGDRREVGGLLSDLEKTIYTLPKEVDSASDDDTYQSFPREDTDVWTKAYKKTMACTVLQMLEPRIMHDDFKTGHGKTYGYFPRRYIGNFERVMDYTFYGEDAFKEANKDLSTCYQNLLKDGRFFMNEKKIIAIDSFGGDVGLYRDQTAPIAFKEIRDFLSNEENKNKYSTVMLFIKKRSELEAYKKLVTEYMEKK